MLTVACVLSEPIKGPRQYEMFHVKRLAAQVEKNLKQPYQFTVVADSEYLGWWAKISLFEPGRFEGRVLYLDLDVTVTGSLDDLADYPEKFAIVKDRILIGFNSSVMVWDAGYLDDLYLDFKPEYMKKYHGDQDWIWARRFDAAVFPLGWCVSYKRIQVTRDDTSDMRVCLYHGIPKPWDLEVA